MGDQDRNTRRGHGEGSIYKNRKGLWVAQFSIGRNPRTGKPERMTFYGKKRGEVRDKLTEAKYKLKQNMFVKPSPIKLSEWLVEWLELYMKVSVKQTTFESYSSWVYKHIIPELGDVILQKLRADEIQRFINNKREELSSRSARHIYRLLNAALDEAVKQKKLSENVMVDVKRPALEKFEINPWTIDEKNFFLKSIREHRLYPLFLLALEGGLRRGELLGSKWFDLDHEKNELAILRSYNVIKGGAKFSEPKGGSKRTIKLPSKVTDELLRWKEKQSKEKEFLGRSYQDQGLIFSTKLGTPIYPREVNREFDRLIGMAQVRRIRVHDMRHTHATVLLKLGVHPKVVQMRLGHKDITITLQIYSHYVLGLDEEAADKLDGVLEIGDTMESDNASNLDS